MSGFKNQQGGAGGSVLGGAWPYNPIVGVDMETIRHPIQRNVTMVPPITASQVVARTLAGNENYEFSVFCEAWDGVTTVIIRLYSKSTKTVVQLEDPLDKFPSVELLNKLALLA